MQARSPAVRRRKADGENTTVAATPKRQPRSNQGTRSSDDDGTNLFTAACLLAIIFRIAMIIWGEWQDLTMTVKYTDIDYRVFTDAAEHITKGGSPYDRPTYRYTPLIAMMLTPNIHLFPAFGKVVFCASDILVGYLCYRILVLRGVTRKTATICASTWLFNPMTIGVSSRGNAESVLCAVVVGVVGALCEKKVALSGLLFGLAVHLKIYPVIYALPLYLVLDGDFDSTGFDGGLWARIKPTGNRILFTLASIAAFSGLTAAMYYLYGERYIEEAYLYHLTRKDIKHNFSMYFYPLYLATHTGWDPRTVALTPFIPQLLLVAAAGWRYARDLPFALLIQTFLFVTYNKVCTSQYFLWYICILPLVLPPQVTRLTWKRGAAMFAAWLLAQLAWLWFAYHLEFEGQDTFLQLWISSVVFFLVNSWIAVEFMLNTRDVPLFAKGSVTQCGHAKRD